MLWKAYFVAVKFMCPDSKSRIAQQLILSDRFCFPPPEFLCLFALLNRSN